MFALPPSMISPFFRDAPKSSRPFHAKREPEIQIIGPTIIHDDYWKLLYKGAQNTISDNDVCRRLADTIWQANENYKIEYSEMRKKRTQFLKKAPQNMITKAVAKKCAGFNVNGGQCGYKATCGTFCKRHAQVQQQVPEILKEDSDSDSESEEETSDQELEEVEFDASDVEDEGFYD